VTACRSCGCTDARACPGGCTWVAPDLCSSCAFTPSPEAVRAWTPAERAILERALAVIRAGGTLQLSLARDVHRALVLDPHLADESWRWAEQAGLDVAEKVTEGLREQIEEIQEMLLLEAPWPHPVLGRAQ